MPDFSMAALINCIDERVATARGTVDSRDRAGSIRLLFEMVTSTGLGVATRNSSRQMTRTLLFLIYCLVIPERRWLLKDKKSVIKLGAVKIGTGLPKLSMQV